MAVTTPLRLAAEQDTMHGPTLALLAELRRNDWGVKWHQGGTAMLVHPKFGRLEAEVDTADPDRVTAYVDGRQVSYRVAMQRARGEI